MCLCLWPANTSLKPRAAVFACHNVITGPRRDRLLRRTRPRLLQTRSRPCSQRTVSTPQLPARERALKDRAALTEDGSALHRHVVLLRGDTSNRHNRTITFRICELTTVRSHSTTSLESLESYLWNLLYIQIVCSRKPQCLVSYELTTSS